MAPLLVLRVTLLSMRFVAFVGEQQSCCELVVVARANDEAVMRM